MKQHLLRPKKLTDPRVPVKDVVRIIEWALKFPYARVCRHSVAGELLNMLEGNGVKISDELAKAVVQADDHTALKLLKKLGRQHE